MAAFTHDTFADGLQSGSFPVSPSLVCKLLDHASDFTRMDECQEDGKLPGLTEKDVTSLLTSSSAWS
jgi:hypothetical protein